MPSKQMEEMLQDRYGYYRKQFETDTVVWDSELDAWLIFDYKNVFQLLNDNRLKANRKGKLIEKMEADELHKQELTAFYSKWLMYMDQPEHSELRKMIQVLINKRNKEVEGIAEAVSLKLFEQVFAEERTFFDAIQEIAEPFTEELLAAYFGIEREDYKMILQRATEVVQFLTNPRPSGAEIESTVHSIKQTAEVMEELISEKRYQAGGLFDLIIHEVASYEDILALVINVTVDGHEPLLSSVKSLIYRCLQASEHGEPIPMHCVPHLVKESLRMDAPFPYCGRMAGEDLEVDGHSIKSGDRVILFISAANYDPQKFEAPGCPRERKEGILSFGAGPHFCAGAVLSKKALEVFANHFIPVQTNWQLSLGEAKWKDTFGFRTLTDLTFASGSRHKSEFLKEEKEHEFHF